MNRQVRNEISIELAWYKHNAFVYILMELKCNLIVSCFGIHVPWNRFDWCIQNLTRHFKIAWLEIELYFRTKMSYLYTLFHDYWLWKWGTVQVIYTLCFFRILFLSNWDMEKSTLHFKLQLRRINPAKIFAIFTLFSSLTDVHLRSYFYDPLISLFYFETDQWSEK